MAVFGAGGLGVFPASVKEDIYALYIRRSS